MLIYSKINSNIILLKKNFILIIIIIHILVFPQFSYYNLFKFLRPKAYNYNLSLKTKYILSDKFTLESCIFEEYK